MLRLDEIISEMTGLPKPVQLEKGFWIEFDENFTKEIPPCWKEKSKPENANKKLDYYGRPIKEEDAFASISTYSDPESEEKSKTEELKTEKSPPNTPVIPDEYDTYGNIELPETY